MFKKIVFLTSMKPDIINLVLTLTQQLQSQLIVVALIEPKAVKKIAQSQGRKESNVLEELESKAWQELYQLENDLKKSGVKITLFLENTSLLELQSFLRSIKADLLILPVERLRDYNYRLTEEFTSELSCPVLLVGKP